MGGRFYTIPVNANFVGAGGREAKKEFCMKNLFKSFGITALMAVIGFATAGCAVAPNYYSMGDVSEENCALIAVSSVSNQCWQADTAISGVLSFITIDGQGDSSQWKTNRVPFVGEGPAIVRVAPGTHTFTGKVFRTSEDRQGFPAVITYDCKAGKGYTFAFHSVANNTRAVLLVISEQDIDENGNFVLLSIKRVAEETTYF